MHAQNMRSLETLEYRKLVTSAVRKPRFVLVHACVFFFTDVIVLTEVVLDARLESSALIFTQHISDKRTDFCAK